jgi:hypothetical protein
LRDSSLKISTVGNNDWDTMQNGVIAGRTVFNQSTTSQIQPPGLPEMYQRHANRPPADPSTVQHMKN